MTFEGKVEGGVIVLCDGVTLPEGMNVTIVPCPTADGTDATGGAIRRRSILELRGLGKEVWQGIDAVDYVRKERESWDG